MKTMPFWVMDKVLILWENVLIYRDFDQTATPLDVMEGGFARMYPLRRFVWRLNPDFITALLKSLECMAP